MSMPLAINAHIIAYDFEIDLYKLCLNKITAASYTT